MLILFLSLFFLTALAAVGDLPLTTFFRAKCSFGNFGYLTLQEKRGTAGETANKRIIDVGGYVTGLCPQTTYTLYFH